MDVEAQRCQNEETQRFLDDLRKQEYAIDTELKASSDEVERMYFTVNRKQRAIDILTNKIENILNKTGVS